jgi:hypothetical protein
MLASSDEPKSGSFEHEKSQERDIEGIPRGTAVEVGPGVALRAAAASMALHGNKKGRWRPPPGGSAIPQSLHEGNNHCIVRRKVMRRLVLGSPDHVPNRGHR